MIVEATRLIAAQLADPTTGINALLAEIPRGEADGEPPPVNLFTWCDDEWVHAWEIPRRALTADPESDGPLDATRGVLILRVASDVVQLPIPGNPEMRTQQPELGLVLLYGRLVDAKVDRRVYPRDCSYTMRAVERCMHRWMDATRLEPKLRTLNDCYLTALRGFSHAVYTPDVPGYVGHALLIDASMVDRWATNIS